MTSKYDAPNHDRQPNEPDENNFVETDRFELLSAYLDEELSDRERQQVRQWLEIDPQFEQLYKQLLELRQRMQNISIPATKPSAEQLSERVFQSISRRRHQRKLWTITGGAIAAAFVASVVGFWANGEGKILQLATSSQKNHVSKPLMVAVSLDKPAVTIPKVAKVRRLGNK
jgi:anti-sigma factor RsiW